MPEHRPSFPWYPKDWLPATRGMSSAARGYHIDMLSLAWLNGGCEADEEALRRSVGAEKAEWRRVWPELEPRWPVVDGRRQNAKLERVRSDATAYTEAKRRAGQIGGRASAESRAEAKQPSSKHEADAQANELAKPKPASALASAVTASLPDGRVSVSPTDVQALFDSWLELTTLPLPRPRELTDDRRAAIRRRLRKRPLSDFREAMRRINASTFCRGGRDGAGWKADFDWLIENDKNVLKAIEGRYDDAADEAPLLQSAGTPLPYWKPEPRKVTA